MLVHNGNRGHWMANMRVFSLHPKIRFNPIDIEKREELAMADTTIVGDHIDVVQAPNAAWGAFSRSGLSWSGIIAGTFTAIAVTIIVIALGSGIGFVLASPFSSSPSAGTLTVLGAVWLVFAQAIGFATGGYIAGRLRRDPAPIHDGETKFRDGANGLVVWAIGVVVSRCSLSVRRKRPAAQRQLLRLLVPPQRASPALPVSHHRWTISPTRCCEPIRKPPLRPVAPRRATRRRTTMRRPNNNNAAMHAQVGRILITAVATNALPATTAPIWRRSSAREPA